MEKNLVSSLRNNFAMVPKLRELFNRVLCRLPTDVLKQIQDQENVFYLYNNNELCSANPLLVTPPVLAGTVVFVLFDHRVLDLWSFPAMGAIVHELAHIYRRDFEKVYAFTDRKPDLDFKGPSIMPGPEGGQKNIVTVEEWATDMEEKTNALCRVWGFGLEIDAIKESMKQMGL